MKKVYIPLFLTLIIQFLILMASPSIIYAKDIFISVETNNKSLSIIPKKIGNVPYVPLRSTLQAYGWSVDWNSVDKKIICVKGKDIAIFTVNSNIVIINNVPTPIDSAPVIVSGVTYIQSKLLATQFGIKVRWNEADNFIIVSDDIYSKIAVKGNGNIIVAGNGIVVSILEPYGIDTLNDTLDYADRILAKNLTDDAIIKYKSILDNISPEENHDIYAHIMNNLGNAYALKSEIRDMTANINYAISYYKKALDIYSADTDPLKYSITRINLGNAYNMLWEATGSDENLLLALDNFSKIPLSNLSESYPLEYAAMQNNIGIAYSRLNQSALAEESLQKALSIYNKYLNIYNTVDTPFEWASIQKKIGDIYKILCSFSPSTYNISRSVYSYEQALKVFTVESYPKEYAKIHQSLGDVFSLQLLYLDSPRETSEVDMLTFPISKAKEQKTTLPMLKTQDNSMQLLKLIKNEYSESLLIYTYENYPFEYAHCNYYLGKAYSYLVMTKNQREFITYALSSYENAIKVYTLKDYPNIYTAIKNQVNEINKLN